MRTEPKTTPKKKRYFGTESLPGFEPALAPEDELIAAEIDRYDAQYHDLYASSAYADLEGDVTCKSK